MNKTPLVTLALAAAAAVLATAPAHAASDYFMKLEPSAGDKQQIKGESADPSFPGAIEISSFHWSAENPASIGSASSGAGAGKAKLKELTVTKAVDSTTPALFQRLAEGRHFQGLELIVRNPASPVGTRYYFQTVFIKSQDQSGAAGDEAPQETLTFQYGAVAQSYTTAKKATANAFGSWNQMTNMAALDTLPAGFK